MANEDAPIEVPMDDALELTASYSLRDVLETLQKGGFIDRFIIRTQVVLIWTKNRRKLESKYLAEEAASLKTFPLKKRDSH